MENINNSLQEMKVIKDIFDQNEVYISVDDLNISASQSTRYDSVIIPPVIQSPEEEKLQKFIQKRTDNRNNIFRAVTIFGLTAVAVGLAITAIDVIIYNTYPSYGDTNSTVVAGLGAFTANFGVIVFSTVPMKFIHLDYIMESHKSRIRWIAYVLAIVLLLLSLVFAAYPPYVGVVLFIPCITLLLNCKHNPNAIFYRFSHKCSFWLMLVPFQWIWSSLHAWLYPNSSAVLLCKVRCIDQNLGTLKIMSLTHFIVMSIAFLYLVNQCIEVIRKEWKYRDYGKIGVTCLQNNMFSVLVICSFYFFITAIFYGLNKLPRFGFYLVSAFAYFIPPFIAWLVTKDRLFNFMATRFDQNPHVLKKDGAFIAGLLNAQELSVGQEYWIIRSENEKNELFQPDDHQYHFRKGIVVEKIEVVDVQSSGYLIDFLKESVMIQGQKRELRAERIEIVGGVANEKSVQIISEKVEAVDIENMNEAQEVKIDVKFDGKVGIDGVAPSMITTGNEFSKIDDKKIKKPLITSKSKQSTALLERVINRGATGRMYKKSVFESTTFDLILLAKKSLRCVDWDVMNNPDLFTQSSVRNVTSASINYYSLSRAPHSYEQIDYFISHSWSDDGLEKLETLREVATRFFDQNGRYPTFWWDRLCFDQNDLGSGLKVLPINIMSCKQMLVLCGPHYADRLWCIWELFTLFSFVSEEEALQRLCFESIGEGSLNQDIVVKKLTEFNVKNAHCFDPNEELKLLHVIEIMGTVQFELRIRKLGSQYHIASNPSFHKQIKLYSCFLSMWYCNWKHKLLVHPESLPP